jgi:HAD superfamily hydrolase (TIGR01490 family)
LGRYSLGSGAGLEEVFAQAAATLAGEEEAVLRARTQAWFQADVSHRLRPGAARALARHRAAGDTLVLATSGSQYAAECALAAYGLDAAVATTFEVRDGRFTGRIAASALGAAKASRVEAWAREAGHDLAEATFYTDSATDLALLERVGRPVVVHPDRRLAVLAKKRGWTVEDWGRASGRGPARAG